MPYRLWAVEAHLNQAVKLRFIEVKGRVHDADTITVTRNEILYSLNKPDDYRLAIVEFLDGAAHRVHYFANPSTANPTSAPTASTTPSRTFSPGPSRRAEKLSYQQAHLPAGTDHLSCTCYR